jgi:hypothetical protein
MSGFVMFQKLVLYQNGKVFQESIGTSIYSSLETMWSPVPHNCNSVGVIAPIPDAYVCCFCSSIAAKALSKYKLLGEEWRE